MTYDLCYQSQLPHNSVRVAVSALPLLVFWYSSLDRTQSTPTGRPADKEKKELCFESEVHSFCRLLSAFAPAPWPKRTTGISKGDRKLVLLQTVTMICTTIVVVFKNKDSSSLVQAHTHTHTKTVAILSAERAHLEENKMPLFLSLRKRKKKRIATNLLSLSRSSYPALQRLERRSRTAQRHSRDGDL